MDVNFGIVIHTRSVTTLFNAVPSRTREFSGNIYAVDEPSLHFDGFLEPEMRIFELTDALRMRLPTRFRGSDWKYVWIDNRSLDKYHHQLNSRTAIEPFAAAPIGSVPIEAMLASLLEALSDWAVLFAWQCDRIDDTIQVDVAGFLTYFRDNLLRSNGPRGFLAVSASHPQVTKK